MAKKNFTITTVATAPSPATSGTSLVVAAGTGSLFALNEPAIIFPVNDQPLVSNAEIVMVTNVSTDTLTITRTQESTSARTIVAGDIIIQGITAKDWNDLVTLVTGKITAFADPNADRIVFWDDSAGAFAALTASTGLTLTGTNLTVRTSSVSQTGIVELATTAETQTGTDATRAVTPDGLHDMTSLAGAGWIKDEDNMASNDDTKVPTQQSVKAYVDSRGSNSFQVDCSGGTSDTYGALSGSVNGSNTTFTVSLSKYVSGSLQVYLNGQLQTQGSAEDWVETTPSSGTFTFNTAPQTGDIILAIYQYSTSATGNADTLDGVHLAGIIDTIYPVGSIYISTVSTNPGTLFGRGTWTAFGAGKTLVGLDSGDTDFDTAEKTGGAKTHTLTVAEMPSHTHSIWNNNQQMSAGSDPLLRACYNSVKNIASGSAGGGGAHNNLQPYIVTYMFKRTA